MPFTQEQLDAIHIQDRPLIVTAGAGSGKTRVLVERFLALLDRHPAWTLPSIVAITFTEKAAREMRDRVRAALLDRLRTAVEAGDEPALIRWLDHQAALTRARIGTIHGLCAALLRANPAEARLDPAFEVLDENEAALLRDDAVEAALARLAVEDHPAAALLAAYDLRQVRGVLAHYAGPSLSGAVLKALDCTPEDLFARWEVKWMEVNQVLLDEIRADLRPLLDAFAPEDLPRGDRIGDHWRTVLSYREMLLTGDLDAVLEAAAVLDEQVNLRGGSAKAWGGGEEHFKAAKQQLKILMELIRALPDDLLPRPGADDVEAARWLVLWREAIRLAADVYTQMKRDRNALDFDDLEARARDLLNQHPAVAARYADPQTGEFKHLLVDEFQDTNPAQRDIIYRLAGVDQPGSAGRLFVVGDPKQSIYAFRGADVSVFDDVRRDLLAWGGQDLPLSMSFRTHSTLVNALNGLFGTILAARTGIGSRYEVALDQPMAAFRPSAPEVAPGHACPLMVIALQKPGRDQDVEQKVNAEVLRQWEAWEVARQIQAMVEQGAPVWDRKTDQYRPVGYGDVAILFQAMTHVPDYEEVFKAAGLPYVTVAGRGYYGRQEVWDLLNLLRALYNPADDLALASALRSPLFGLSDEALFALRLARAEDGAVLPLWEALFSFRDSVPDPASPPGPLSIQNGEREKADQVPSPTLAGEGPGIGAVDAAFLFPPDEIEVRAYACDVLRELRDLAGRATVADLLIRALHLTGFPALLTGLPDGARRRGNVEKLVALARESGRVSLGSFLDYARSLTAREVREGEAAVEIEGAVTLMSVHASKGLEYPVIVLADAAWGSHRGSPEIFRYDLDAGPVCKLPAADPDDEPPLFAWRFAALAAERRDRAERRRLLYVGATRAQDLLIVSGSLYRASGQCWLRQWLAALGLANDDLFPADDTQVIKYAWGRAALRVPLTVTVPEHLAPRRTTSGWDHPAVAAGIALEGVDPVRPPLLAGVPVEATAPARFLTATHVAQLGRAPYYDPTARGWKSFRHAVLHDAPEPLRPLPGPANLQDERRIVGEIVHRALQAWLLPATTPRDLLVERLRAYAWEYGVSDEGQVIAAVTAALDLLAEFDASETRGRIERAGQVFRELPFMFHWGERTIQGRIDVLFLVRDQWHVLDYKTALVSRAGARHNAQRYYLQVGMYARAVEARTGQTPQTHLYYIHPAQVVTVDQAQWRPALDRLEDDLRVALA